MSTKKAFAAAGAVVLGLYPATTLAHTNSIGYVGDGSGGVTFWYGSWHSGTTFNEAEIKLEGSNGTSYGPTITQFTELESSTPSGLVPGTNYFTSDGTQLVPYDPTGATNGGTTQESYTWQGVNFTGLAAGDYTFTYIPLGDAESYCTTCTPTADWMPMDEIIRTSTITITAAALSGDADGDGINDVTGQPVTTVTGSSTSNQEASSTETGTRTTLTTASRTVVDTDADGNRRVRQYTDTVQITIPTSLVITASTPVTIDTYSDGSIVMTIGDTVISSTSTDTGEGSIQVVSSALDWTAITTMDVVESIAVSGAPVVTRTPTYKASENGGEQKINVRTKKEKTTPTVKTITTTPVITTTYADDSVTVATGDPVVTYEDGFSYDVSYSERNYFGRVDQHEVLDKFGTAINNTLNHFPSKSDQPVRVISKNYLGWGEDSNGYTSKSRIIGGGLEIDIKPTWTIGGQYNNINIDLDGSDSTSSLRKNHYGFFSMLRGNDLSLGTNVGFAQNQYAVDRNVEKVFENSSTTNGKEWWVNNRLYWHLNKWITPLIGYTVGGYQRDGFTESGSIQSARKVGGVSKTTHSGEAGLVLSARFGGKNHNLFGVGMSGILGTNRTGELAAAVDVAQTLYIEGIHQVSDGAKNNIISAKVKFKF